MVRTASRQCRSMTVTLGLWAGASTRFQQGRVPVRVPVDFRVLPPERLEVRRIPPGWSSAGPS